MREFEIYFDDLNAEAQNRFRKAGLWHENINLSPLAIIEIENEEDGNSFLCRVPFISVWDGNNAIETSVVVNTETGEVGAIDVANEHYDVDVCEEQYIVLNGQKICVYEDKYGFDYWADLKRGSKMKRKTMCDDIVEHIKDLHDHVKILKDSKDLTGVMYGKADYGYFVDVCSKNPDEVA